MKIVFHKIVFLIILILPSQSIHGTERQRERRRQAQITALLTTHQHNKSKKTCGIAQKLLDGEQEECERKISADHVPIAPLARPGRQQRDQNKAYMQELRTVLSHLPESIKQFVVDYARPEWCLDRTFKNHKGRVYDITIAGDKHEMPGLSFATGVKTEVAVWDTDTGALRRAESCEGSHKPFPRQLSGFSRWLNSGVTDFATSPDGQKMAATTFDKNILYIWPSELSLAGAIASKKVLPIRNRGISQDNNDNEPASDNPFTAVTFSPCSNYVFAGAADGTMHQLNAETAETVYSFDHNFPVTAIATSRDGNMLYAGLQDGSVSVWQGELLPPLTASVAIPAAPDAPQSALMEDDPVKILDNHNHQRKIADWYCLEDCTNCYKHGKKCCSLCAQACKTSVACCCSGASCVLHCPRACVCGCGYAICVKKCCVPLLRRLCAPFIRRRQ